MSAIVVTGSASGLGAAIAARLKREGRTVIGVDRHQADVVADLGTDLGRQRALESIRSASAGTLDGVVSCAGLGPYDEAKAITRVNYFAAIAMLDELQPLLARGHSPAAVAISSVGGAIEAMAIDAYIEACCSGDEKLAQELIEGRDGNVAYVNAKRALALAMRRRAPAWGAAGIRLNAVAPGKTETPMLDRLRAGPATGPAIEAMKIPLGRSAAAEEVAAAVVFLLGPDASYVHGQVLFVDGGAEAVLRPDTF